MSMDWSNERYVRFYTRDTVTWKRWTWEARSCWGLLLRKVDRSGLLDTGTTEKIEALALMLDIPCEVAHRVVPQWLSAGSLVERAAGFSVPTFLAAQEAKQSDKLRQSESRANRLAASLRNNEAACHTPSQPVTDGHTASHAVTPAVPSRAVPSQPLKEEPELRSVPQLELVSEKPKTRPPPKPPNPEAEFERFASSLTPDEASVFEAYETHMGVRLGADWGLKKFVAQKLKAHHASELCAAIRGHASDAWRREHSPSLRAILRDASVIASLARAGAA